MNSIPFVKANPEITKLDTIGISTTDSRVILALKISDNPMIEEDEPAILYNGIHHAKELPGAEICMYMIDSLVRGYRSDPQITSWIDSTEIWIVPIVNPDGHEIVMTEMDTSWRKNTRDNDGNDTFDIYYDGVDLNRNYDFNWHMAMGRDPWDMYYRGLYAFSELETQAIRDFSSDQHFIFAVNYHGPDLGVGEIIYYPWKWDGQQSPDSFAIKDVADSMASLIINDAGDSTYAIGRGNATSPKARNWQYGVKGIFAYTVEVSTCFIPPGSLVTDICQRNLAGAFYLLDRIHGASITGCITDSTNRIPLQAEVRILEAYDPDLEARLSDSAYGRYRRILNPGTYTVEVYKVGYHTVTIPNVVVLEDVPTILNIQLSHSPWIVYHSHSINDSMGGNGDGFINPGESILMPVTLENTGDLTSYGVICTLRTSSSYITITDSVQNYGNIDPGSTAISWESYAYTISDSCPNGHETRFSLYIWDTDSNFWMWDAPDDSVVTADIVYESHIIDDPAPGGNNNGELNPGETAHIIVTLHNSGPSGLSDVNAVLRTSDPWVLFITDSLGSFGDIPAGSSSNNDVDHFSVSVYLSAPAGYQVRFSLDITGSGSTYVYEDTSNFSVIIGEPTIAAPTGPDEYGYWAYDDTDTLYGYAPLYSWFEINPNHGGPGDTIFQITNTDGGMVTLDLPFTFKYYGTDYDSISVCSNGFLKLGSTSCTTGTGYNSSIPNDSGPNRMVAPFWDDLKADQYGDICVYHDDTVWIVEFDSVNHYGHYPPLGKYETFQVVLYDSAYHPTPTGDGEIVFRYRIVEDADSNTVGIENQDETIGIQWLYNNNYDPAAASLVPDRAIRFTTYSPITDSMPWVYVINYMINDSNGIPDPGDTVDLIVYLENGGDSSANSVGATLQSSDSNITVLDSFALFGDMPPDSQANNASDPYIFVVDSNITDTLADFSLVIYANDSTYQTFAYFTIILGSPLGIAEGEHQLPYTYALLQNYPNPMRNITTIRYQLPKKEKVSLKIYDVVGRLVKTLINESKEPGYYTIHWHGKDDRERKASAGVYFYRIQAGTYTSTKKMVLFK
ncbi:hypothetical protein ES705_11826 [subsurface metagenome]